MELVARGALFARFRMGSVRVTTLSDGHAEMDAALLRGPGDRPLDGALPPGVPVRDGRLRLAVNAFLVEAEGRLALVDTGASDAWQATTGRLPEALAEAGVDPGRIALVALTHTHVDHASGLVGPGGAGAFPNLEELWVPEAELPLFREQPRLAPFHDRARGFRPGQVLGGRLEAVAAPGHEIGHSCFRLAEGDEALLVLGDVVHVPSLQLPRPEITWTFEADQDAARASRLAMLGQAARDGCWVAGAHLDAPGIGRVRREGAGFRLLPP